MIVIFLLENSMNCISWKSQRFTEERHLCDNRITKFCNQIFHFSLFSNTFVPTREKKCVVFFREVQSHNILCPPSIDYRPLYIECTAQCTLTLLYKYYLNWITRYAHKLKMREKNHSNAYLDKFRVKIWIKSSKTNGVKW